MISIKSVMVKAEMHELFKNKMIWSTQGTEHRWPRSKATAADAALQPEAAQRASLWLDRYKIPFQIASVLACAPSGPLFAATEIVKQPLDPRYNPFDWEAWHECDVFRQEVERKLQVRR